MLFYMQFQIIDHLFTWYLFPGQQSYVHPLQTRYAFHGMYVDMEMEAWMALSIGLCLDGIIVTSIFSLACLFIERQIRRREYPLDIN